MADKPSENKDSESPDKEEGHVPLAGQKLAKARRANDISIAEIAKALHLDEPKVQALEENQFDVLGAPVFAKGHLRKYAELVGVPIDDVLSDYYQVHRSVGAPPVVGPKRQPQRDLTLGPWLVGLIVLVLIVGIAAWWLMRQPAVQPAARPGNLQPNAVDEQVDNEPAQPLEAPEQAVTGMASEDEEGDEPVDTDVETPEAAEEPPETAAAGAPVSAGQLTVAMSFTGDCWTEVTDAEGKRLFFGLGRDGQTITRSGAPPLRALFGNRNNVTVTLDGEDFPLRGDGRRGNTARVTLDKP